MSDYNWQDKSCKSRQTVCIIKSHNRQKAWLANTEQDIAWRNCASAHESLMGAYRWCSHLKNVCELPATTASLPEWVSSFLTAHQHIIGYSVPWLPVQWPYGHFDQWVRVWEWGFLLVFCSIHSPKMQCCSARGMRQTNRRMDGRITALLNSP